MTNKIIPEHDKLEYKKCTNVRWHFCRRPFPLSCLDIRYSVSDLDFPDFSEEHAKHRINAIINASELEKISQIEHNRQKMTNFLAYSTKNDYLCSKF